MSRFPQVKENVRVTAKELTPAVLAEVERLNARAGTDEAACSCGRPAPSP